MSKLKSIKNQKFGKLLISEEFKNKDGRQIVKCVCDCGIVCEKFRCHIISGNTTSCGCQKVKGPMIHNFKGFGEIHGDYWSSLKRGAGKRGFVFDLEIKYGWELFQKQNGCCAISGVPLTFSTNRRRNYKNQTASLDRIDSEKGYVKNNVWWVHKDVNKIKSNLTLEELQKWSKLIASHRPKDQSKWDKRFLSLAKFVSTWSKDPSTQVGAVIFDDSNRIISLGYNGLSTGIEDKMLEDRDRKLKLVIHAETNAIMFAKQNLKGCSIATWPFMPCSNCSSNIIQAGITRVIYPEAIGEKATRWADSFRLSQEQFDEAGVIQKQYKLEEI